MADKQKRGKIGVVVAWRHGESDLQATIDSAAASAGKASTIISVEDKTMQGPARTRHRGIEAADGCDVIAIIDAHMRFDGNCIQSLARHVRKTCGLVCPLVHHNDKCDFSGGHYAGGRIVYKSQDGKQKQALSVKWSRDTHPGQRGSVIGACYVMPRELYYRIGQPLAALPGWGCDEEALSISAWMAGVPIECTGDKAAHLYRAKTPWQVTPQEHANVHASRMALIHAVVSEIGARKELEAWQRSWVAEGVKSCDSAEAERWRLALLKLPRKWREWLATVCEPDEINGKQDAIPRGESPILTALKESGTLNKALEKLATVETQKSRANYGAFENRRTCHACGSANSVCQGGPRYVGRLIVRYRLCECGARRQTSEVIPDNNVI